ncbi:MAG: hypothetical protein ABIZ49_02445 [Opitutaceae bacterium]
MKTLPFLVLAVSLAINAAFAFFLVRGPGEAATARPSSAAAQVPASDLPPSASPAVDPATWSKMQTAELPTLVSRLRAAGFPPEFVRAILAAQINESFAARHKALDPDADKRAFWKNAPPNVQLQTAQRQLYREQEKALRDLLGDDADPTDPMYAMQQQRQFGGVPPEKMADARRIMREYADKNAALFPGGMVIEADYEKSQALQREQRAAIAALLTPAELAEFNLRSSPTANNLRSQLATFNPTEQEFRAIYQLQFAFDEQYLSPFYMGVPTPEQQQQQRQRSEAQKLLTDQIKAMLGTRAEEYTRSTDYNYQRTTQLVARLELPPETAPQVYTVQKEFEQRRMTIAQNRDLPAEQRTQQLTALHDEATAKLTPLLGGTRGLEAYKTNGGTWLQSLVPRPAPTPTR